MTMRYLRRAVFLLLFGLGAWPLAHAADRGGIAGDAIGLDWVDSRYSDYLDRVKRGIQERLTYPCAPDSGTRRCEPLNAQLIVEFGILASGQLRYVEVVRSSGDPLYDDAAVSAIRAASPYPAIPPDLIKAGSTGLPIRSQFTHVMQPRLIEPRPTTQRPPSLKPAPISWLVLASLLAAALAVVWSLMLWRRLRAAREASRHQASPALSLEGPGEARRAAAGEVDQGVIARDALLSHGWHDDGEAAVHGFTTSSARSYSHPELAGHRVNVAPTGEWEHTKVPGMPARGSTADELAQHLGAIHGTLSIADLHLPGRRKA